MEESQLIDIAQRELGLRVARGGIWWWDIAADKVEWCSALYRMHGIEPEAFTHDVAGFMQLVHPDDREEVMRRIASTLEVGLAYDFEFRTIRGDGKVRWLSTTAKLMRNPDGSPRGLIGATYDITFRRALVPG